MKDVYRTSTGIEIGSMYRKPMPQLTQEEEMIQRALLHTSGPDSVWSVLYKIFLVVLSLLLAAYLWSNS
jgi:hypothetical protein